MVTSLIRTAFKSLASEAAQSSVITAAVLATTAVTGTTIAVTVYEAGDQGAAELERTVTDAVARVSNTLEVRGGISVNDVDGDGRIDAGDTLTLPVAVGPGTTAIALEPTDGTAPSITLFTDAAAGRGAAYAVTWRLGTGPALEPGELADLTVTVPDGVSAGANDALSLELIASTGGSMVLERRLPAVIQGFTYLF